MKDADAMLKACELASSCTPTARAFNVGAVLTDAQGRMLATGFSRELEGNTHAEECCLLKLERGECPPRLRATGPGPRPRVIDLSHCSLAADGRLAEARGGTMFSSMEPCSVRLSGNRACTDRCIEAKLARVVLAIKEPGTFVKCEGVDKLRASGVEVVIWEDEACAALAAAANSHLLAEDSSEAAAPSAGEP